MTNMRRSPIQWPGDARLAFMVEVSYEAFPEDLGTPGSSHPGRLAGRKDIPFAKDLASITDRQYGERVGIFRLLDVLSQEQVKSTFFTSGAVIEAYPEIVRDIAAAGHELSGQNYRHEFPNMQAPEVHRRELEQVMGIWERVLSRRPAGFVTSGYWSTDETPTILSDLGITYWMDLLHDELPYTLRLPNGKELTVLSHSGLFTADLQQHGAAPRSHRDMFRIYKDWFDYLYEEGATNPSQFSIALHPFALRPHMAMVVREFLRYVKGFPGVWITTCHEVARWWLENYRHTHVELWPNYGTAIRRRMAGK